LSYARMLVAQYSVTSHTPATSGTYDSIRRLCLTVRFASCRRVSRCIAYALLSYALRAVGVQRTGIGDCDTDGRAGLRGRNSG